MNITHITTGAAQEAAKHTQYVERATAQISEDLAADRFPSAIRLRDLASHRVQKGLWAIAVLRLTDLDPDADVVKAAQVLRQLAEKALQELLHTGEASDAFSRALRAATREGHSWFYQEATAFADSIISR